jgi:hypothetical protein
MSHLSFVMYRKKTDTANSVVLLKAFILQFLHPRISLNIGFFLLLRFTSVSFPSPRFLFFFYSLVDVDNLICRISLLALFFAINDVPTFEAREVG